jgi:hypothetical protein
VNLLLQHRSGLGGRAREATTCPLVLISHNSVGGPTERVVGFDYSADSIVRDDAMVFKALEVLTRWRLFSRAGRLDRTWDIIVWWESRRIPYNLIVGATGVSSAIVIFVTGSVTEHVVGDAIGVSGSPLFEIFAVIIYGIMANICFTGGWVLELFSHRIWGARAEAFGEIAFTWGTLFSVLLTLVPAALIVGWGAYRIIAHGWKY